MYQLEKQSPAHDALVRWVLGENPDVRIVFYPTLFQENTTILRFKILAESLKTKVYVQKQILELMHREGSSLRRSQFLGPFIDSNSYQPSGSDFQFNTFKPFVFISTEP